jgi:hypothetical protein
MNRKLTEMLRIPESIRVPYLGGVLYRYFTKLDNKIIAESQVPAQPLNQEKRDTIITASLTSFPARIHYVHLAIKSLMLQSCKPDRIILWLANEQFPDHALPETLTELEKYGLEIKWCDDLYGHKKYFYCIQEQKENEVVITFDDDIIYPIDAIKRLMAKHREYPDCLICERAQAIVRKADGTLENPGRWRVISDVGIQKPSFSLNPSPGGGCLIPYKAFYKDAYDKETICALAYKHDDLWYMFMAAQNGTKTIKTRKYHRSFSVIVGSQAVQMATENIVGNKNMEAMQSLAAHYPEAYRRIVLDRA